MEEEEDGEETPGTWTCVTCNSFSHPWGPLCSVEGGDQIVSLLPRVEGLGTLERREEGGCRQVGLRDGDASRHAANFTLPTRARSCYPCSSAKGWVSSEAKPDCCLWLSLAGVPWPCQPPALPQHPPRVLYPCSSSLPSVWLIWGKRRRKIKG